MFNPIKTTLDPAKSVFRLRAAAERAHAAKARPDAPRHAARLFFDSVPFSAGDKVGIYYPIKDELDTWPLAEEIWRRGGRVLLPVVGRKHSALTFRDYKEGDRLIKGAFGAKIPEKAAIELTPDIVVTPLLAFDRRGGRLGYGGGFYDRTLEQLRASNKVCAVGFAFGAQEVDAVPLGPLDQPLDWIVTEREAIRITG